MDKLNFWMSTSNGTLFIVVSLKAVKHRTEVSLYTVTTENATLIYPIGKLRDVILAEACVQVDMAADMAALDSGYNSLEMPEGAS